MGRPNSGINTNSHGNTHSHIFADATGDTNAENYSSAQAASYAATAPLTSL